MSAVSPHNTMPPSAFDLLHAELSWAEARLTRLIREQRDNDPVSRRNPFNNQCDEAPRGPNVATLRSREVAAREAFDALVARCPAPTGIDAIVQAFGLDRIDRAALLLSTGVALHRRTGTLLSELEHGCGPTCSVDCVFTFEELGLEARIEARTRFRPTAPLFANDLLDLGMGHRYKHPEQLLDASLSVTARGLELVLGNRDLAEEMEIFSTLEVPRTSFEQLVLPPADRVRLLSVLAYAGRVRDVYDEWGINEVVCGARGLLFMFTGAPGTGKTSTAHAVAHQLGRRVLNVDIPTFIGHSDAARFLPGLFREARLHDAILFFDECEMLFGTRRNGNMLMTLLLSELDRFEGIAVLATNLPEQLDPALDRRVRVRIDFGRPDAISRAAIWRLHLPPNAVLAADVDVDALSRRFDLSGGYIRNAVLNAVAAAVSEAPAAPVLRQRHLDTAARDQAVRPAAQNGSGEAQEPRATLADVYLPAVEAQLVREMVAAAGVRRTVFDRWGIAARQSGGRGIIALFYGPPGTGKTLCAEAIAGELSRPLLRVTLPSVLSKWVGEAERNLAQAFANAALNEAVLLLDEIDGLLMARGEGRASRHDDSIVNTLLDLLDRHDGVVVLCTNRPDVLDCALTRRLSWQIGFRLPDAAARTAIWQQTVPATATGDQRLDMAALGARYALSGGQIRTAAIRAASRAAAQGRTIDIAALAAAAAEELDGPTTTVDARTRRIVADA